MATIIIDVICEKQTTEVTTRKLKNPKAPKETGKIKGEATKRGRGKAKPLVQKESGLAVGHKSGRRREKEGRKEGRNTLLFGAQCEATKQQVKA